MPHPDSGAVKQPCTRAFPQGNTLAGGNAGGMDLRDWFAGQAIGYAVQAANTNSKLTGLQDGALYAWAARMAYGAADAMTAERERAR